MMFSYVKVSHSEPVVTITAAKVLSLLEKTLEIYMSYCIHTNLYHIGLYRLL